MTLNGRRGRRMAFLAILAFAGAGWGAGCSKGPDSGAGAGGTGPEVSKLTPDEPKTVEPVKSPEEPKTVEPVKPPEEPKTVEPVKPPEEPKTVEPLALRETSIKAFETKLVQVFGSKGIQTMVGVKKFDDSWEKSVEPLMKDKFKAYHEKYTLAAAPAPAAGGDEGGGKGGKKKKKKKGGGTPVTEDAKKLILDKTKAAFDVEWGIAEADLPKLVEALETAFKDAKGFALPSDEAPAPAPAAKEPPKEPAATEPTPKEPAPNEAIGPQGTKAEGTAEPPKAPEGAPAPK